MCFKRMLSKVLWWTLAAQLLCGEFFIVVDTQKVQIGIDSNLPITILLIIFMYAEEYGE